MVRLRAHDIGWRAAVVAVLVAVCAYGAVWTVMHFGEEGSRGFGPGKTIIADRPFSTHIYFNNDVGQAGILDVVKSQIEAAHHTIEIAMFSFASPEIRQALYDAAARGVKITLVLDRSRSGQHDLFLGDLPPGIQRIDAGKYDAADSRGTVYMHDKFMITDRNYPTESLITGSLNFTSLGEKYNQSFLLETADPDLVSVYGSEFDLLKDGVFGIRKLGEAQYDPWAASIRYSDSFLDVWFSPGFGQQSLKYRILDGIRSATSTIDVMMWYLTDQEIASALARKAGDGVRVRIIAEAQTADDQDSMIPYLESAETKLGSSALEIVLDTKLGDGVRETLPDDFSPFIHHHMIIIDGSTVILGSGNWSLWGFYNNDENALVTDDAYLIDQSQRAFDHFYSVLR